jgi:hypothetical protein
MLMLMTLANDNANANTVVGDADNSTFFSVADDSTLILRWWSANKFCKLQVRKLATIKNLLYLLAFRKCGNLRICGFWTKFLKFSDLQLGMSIIFLGFRFADCKKICVTSFASIT